MATLIDVESVLTHLELDNYLGGKLGAGMHLAPQHDLDTRLTRTEALDAILSHLASRLPPIYEADIARPAELKQALKHGAAEMIYRFAMTSGANAELFHALMKSEGVKFGDQINALRPTVAGNVQATAWSVGISRR